MEEKNNKERKLLGQILLERGVISLDKLNKALEIQRREGGLLGELLVKLGYTTEEEIAHCLSLQYSFPYLPLENYEISRDVIKLIPKNVASHYCVVPLDKIGNTLTVAMADPLNYHAVEDLKEITKCEIQVFISTPSDIRKCIENYY